MEDSQKTVHGLFVRNWINSTKERKIIMFKEVLRTFSKILGCASLIALSMNVNSQAAASSSSMMDLIRTESVKCSIVHPRLQFMNISLDPKEISVMRGFDITGSKLDGSEEYVVACGLCQKYDPSWTNLRTSTIEGKALLEHAVQSYLTYTGSDSVHFVYAYIK